MDRTSRACDNQSQLGSVQPDKEEHLDELQTSTSDGEYEESINEEAGRESSPEELSHSSEEEEHLLLLKPEGESSGDSTEEEYLSLQLLKPEEESSEEEEHLSLLKPEEESNEEEEHLSLLKPEEESNEEEECLPLPTLRGESSDDELEIEGSIDGKDRDQESSDDNLPKLRDQHAQLLPAIASQFPPQSPLFGETVNGEDDELEDILLSDPAIMDTECESEAKQIGTHIRQGLVNDELLSDLDTGMSANVSDEDILLPATHKRSRREELGFIVSDSSDDAEEFPQLQQQVTPQGTLPVHLDKSTPMDGSSTDSDFDYRHKADRLTAQEMRSFAFHDISVTHHVPRAATEQYRRIQPAHERPSDYRTTRRRIENLTGVKEVCYDCCPNSCVSYALPKYADLTECPECKHPRYKSKASRYGTKSPYAQHGYVPVAHRLKLMYADKQRSREMMEYRLRTKDDAEKKVRSDFWTGTLYRDLKQLGLFPEDTDIALSLSTDGVKVFKTRSTFNIWPLLLINMNLPPSIRFKRQNMLLVGFIPGPNNPKDLDSFLWPLIQEMLRLEVGLEAWNATTERQFILHAYITIVTADMPGREKLMRMKGNRAYRYCNYCTCRGIYNGAIYCPFSPPTDPPGTVKDDVKLQWRVYDRSKLPMRNDKKFREDAKHISETDHQAAANMTGIAGESILTRLKSIDFPRSFPPDSMHLFFENVIPAMVRHYRGIFFKTRGDNVTANSPDDGSDNNTSTDSDSDADDEDSEPNHINLSKTLKRKHKGNETSKSVRQKKKCKLSRPVLKRADIRKRALALVAGNKAVKFKKTEDPWTLSPEDWQLIGEDQKASAPMLPAAFGRAPRHFAKHCHEFSGEEWKQQATLFLPIYLQDKLPTTHYKAFCDLVETIGLTTENTLQDRDIQDVELGMRKFSTYYENTFYGYKWDRLAACLPVFHQLIHVADALHWIGPMYIYAQWGMERMCGMLARTAKSRVAANRNMEINLLLAEQKHMLGYVLHPDDWVPRLFGENDGEEEEDAEGAGNELEDADGNLLLSRIFRCHIAGSRPEPARQHLSPGCSRYQLMKFSGSRTATPVESRWIREFMATKPGYDPQMCLPMHIQTWKWCRIRDEEDNKKRDFKVTSLTLRGFNNTRNASMIAYEEGECTFFGEVQFFFTAHLPAELEFDGSHSDTVAIDTDDEDSESGTKLYQMACIKEIPVEGYGGGLLRRIRGGGHKVILVSQVTELIGLMSQRSRQYLTTRYTSLLYQEA